MGAERASFPVKMMARLLGVSRSGFYEWLKRTVPPDPWSAGREAVERAWLRSRGRFGARLVRAELMREGVRLTLYRVRKIMSELGMRGVVKNARKATTVADPGVPARPDLVGRNFRPAVPTTVLVGDITYLRTGEGWLYLAVVIDLCTRMVAGWSMSERMTVNLPRFRLHPYAAIGWRSSSGRLARSNSSGLRYPSPEWIPTLLQRRSMYSKISSAAWSRLSKVRACAHSALMTPMSDSMAALSQGDDIDPIDGSIPASRIVLPSSSEAYCEPWSP